MNRAIILCFVAVVLFAGSVSFAQGSTYATLDNLGVDTINVMSLNAHLTIPIRHKAGRGKNFDYDLTYDTSVWMPNSIMGNVSWLPISAAAVPGWSGMPGNGVPLFGGMPYTPNIGYRTVVGSGQCQTGPYQSYPLQIVTYTNFYWLDPAGVTHNFTLNYTYFTYNGHCGPSGAQPSGTQLQLASDGSGYTLFIIPGATPSGYVVDKLGNVMNGPSSSYPNGGSPVSVDRNGNEITVNGNYYYTDTLGQTALTVSGSAPYNVNLSYPTPSGGNQTYVVKFMSMTVQTNFGCTVANGGMQVTDYGPLAQNLVSEIDLPDGSQYSFTYEPTPNYPSNVTGRLASVTLPTGGTISYTYTGANNGIVCTNGSAAGLKRTISADSGSTASTRTYTRSFPNGPGSYLIGPQSSHTEVVDGAQNYSEYDFVQSFIPNGTGVTPSGNTYEINRSIYQGINTGTPVLARRTTYLAYVSQPSNNMYEEPITGTDTYETLDGLQTHGATTKHDQYGNQIESDVYDFAAGTTSRGALLRQEIWTYGYILNDSNNHAIGELPTQDAVYDTSGILAGETTYGYDSTAPTPTSGVPQHVAATGTRGNLTSRTVYANSGTSYASNMTYYDTGLIATITGPAPTSALTTYTYDSTLSSYLTGVTLPTPSSGIQIGSGFSYDTTYTGLLQNTTDPNSQPTSFTYADPFLRPTLVNNADGGKTTFSYAPNQAGQQTYQSTSVYSDTEIQYDAYGRPSRTAVAKDQSGNWYQADTCYNASSNTVFSSYSYVGSGFSGTSKVCSGNGDTTTYDAVGRVTNIARVNGESVNFTYLGRAVKSVDENNVTRIAQVDGLGRTTIVCEVAPLGTMLNSPSPVSCGTDIAGTGYVSSYNYTLANPTTTVTQDGQTRTFVSDWLGRPTSVTEPERGTTTYSYAYNSTGLQVTRQRPKANQTSASVLTTTTTQYDKLGRVISIGYTDGTPTKTFAYDAAAGANFTDLSQTQLKGRVSLASVSNAGTAFSYDPVGRISALDECLPSGPCGTTSHNRQLLYTYDWAGNLLTSTDGSMPISTATKTTYTVSPAGELLSMTSSLTNAANIVSNVQNGPNGPVSYNLGNSLSGSYQYDALGRIGGSSVTSGSTTVYGFTSVWKGSQLQNSSDLALGQTSNYGYDGFNRLGSRTVTAGTGPNYAWVYDRWGNRLQENKTGGTGSGPSIQINISTANNQITTSGFTYDAAGNMSNDGQHSYTYDAEGNITQVDGGSKATYTYNALNQRVRTATVSATTEYVFNAGGQRVSEWNAATQTQLKGHYYWGGKPVAYYDTTSTHFEHQDWTGTERVRTSYNGAVETSYTNLPFGDGHSTLDGDAYHFAMLDHDTETDTDHADFRQYSNNQGRFMSPDPYDGSYDPTNPQSMNRYVYSMNNPLTYVDPSGEDCVYDEGGGAVGVVRGDCRDPNDNGHYVDCDGCIIRALMSGGTASLNANGDLIITNAPGGYGYFTIDGFGDPVSTIPNDPGNPAVAPNHNFDPTDPGYQLAVALGKTGVYSLNSPCFVPAFYGASAGIAAAGVAAANLEEIGTVAADNYPTLLHKAISWLNRLVGRTPLGPPVSAMAATAAGQVSQFCNSH